MKSDIRETFAVCFVIIHDQDTVFALFKASGTKHSENGQRRFAEAVYETAALLPSVSWIEAIEGESWDVYACRVRRTSSSVRAADIS